jgi:hypothetical protein
VINSPIVGGTGASVKVTLTELGALVPPGPLQVRTNVYVPATVTGPTGVPVLEVATVPLQPGVLEPPLAVHEVAFEVVQRANSICPTCPVCATCPLPTGMANELMVGGGGVAVTLTVTDTGALVPPGPLQVKA